MLEHAGVHGDELQKHAALAGHRAQVVQPREERGIELREFVFRPAVVAQAGAGPEERLDVPDVARRWTLFAALPQPDAREIQPMPIPLSKIDPALLR
jgi:hypothetical protein